MSTPSPMASAKLNPFIKKSSPISATATATIAENDNIASVKLGDPVTANPVENPFGKAAMKRNLLIKKTITPMTNNNESNEPDKVTKLNSIVNIEETSTDNEKCIKVTRPDPEIATPIDRESHDDIDAIETDSIESESISQSTEEKAEIEVENVNEVMSTVDSVAETEIEAENIDSTENETATETPVKKRRRRTKQQIEDSKDSENSKNTETNTEVINNESIQLTNNSTVDFATVCNEFSSFSNDNEWTEFVNDVELSYNDIKITPDITSASLIGITCQLANLRDKIWQPYQYYKNQYDKLSSKEPEGLIERTKRIYMDDTANNDMKRKKSATAACMNYTTKDGKIINLYDFLDEVRARYYFLNTIIANIEFKKSLLVTISSALKLENNLAN